MHMAGFIPLILVLVSFGVIIFIVVRRFPQLATLDIDNLPRIKETKKKEEILRKRAEEQSRFVYEKLRRIFAPVGNLFIHIQKWFRGYVYTVQQKAHNARKKELQAQPKIHKDSAEREEELKQLMQEAQYAFDDKVYDTAEKKYIAAIKLDARNEQAYSGLGDVYHAQGQQKEARETYRFVLQLNPHNEHALMQLGEMAEAMHEIEEAVGYYQQAVLVNDNIASRFVKLYELLMELKEYTTALEAIRQALILEPQNPKFLDNFIEASIMVQDKKSAEEGYHQLRMVNPENQKLSSFKQRIDELN